MIVRLKAVVELDKPGSPVTVIRATPGETSAVTPADRGWKKIEFKEKRSEERDLDLRKSGVGYDHK